MSNKIFKAITGYLHFLLKNSLIHSDKQENKAIFRVITNIETCLNQ